jgi:hypothetical protein
MTLNLRTGVPKLVLLRMKDSVVKSEILVVETIGDESRTSSTLSQNSELKFLMRSQSYENERGCYEIV